MPSSLFWECNCVVTWREAGGAAHCETIAGSQAPMPWCTADRAPPALGLRREQEAGPCSRRRGKARTAQHTSAQKRVHACSQQPCF